MGFTLGLALWGAACSTTPAPAPITPTEHARMIVEIANGALQEGDPTGALQKLSEAEALDPELPELHHSKALALFAKRDLPGAVESAKRAIEIRPNYPDANNTLGKLYLDQQNYREAEVYLKKAASNHLYREAYKANTNLGILYYRLGKTADAETVLNSAIQDAPLRACAAYYYRGHVRLSQSRVNDALKDYEKATQKFCGNFADAHYAMGVAYAQKKDYPLARKKFLQVKQLYPETTAASRAMEKLRYLP